MADIEESPEQPVEALLKDSKLHAIKESDGIHVYYILLKGTLATLDKHHQAPDHLLRQPLQFLYLLDKETHVLKVLASWTNASNEEVIRITERAALYSTEGFKDFLLGFVDQGMRLTSEQASELQRRLLRIAPFGLKLHAGVAFRNQTPAPQ